MKRREFLILFGAFCISGCGGGGGSSQIKTQVNLEGSSRNIEINSNSTVIEAIAAAFPYKKGDNETTINGITDNWRYTVNGQEPSIYAGNYRLNSDSTIDLYRIS
ncbi:MAG: DUF4430 domain-containing protein [Patescibacteria group bacterium]|nr:DUF4430 domain-containing protein [Patescibacteria group bacterium]